LTITGAGAALDRKLIILTTGYMRTTCVPVSDTWIRITVFAKRPKVRLSRVPPDGNSSAPSHGVETEWGNTINEPDISKAAIY